jgi:hypothetical protein
VLVLPMNSNTCRACGAHLTIVRGVDLRVGNMIEVWWKPGFDIITELTPYSGPLIYLFPDGAQLATFVTRAMMTIDNADYYHVVRQKRPHGT